MSHFRILIENAAEKSPRDLKGGSKPWVATLATCYTGKQLSIARFEVGYLLKWGTLSWPISL